MSSIDYSTKQPDIITERDVWQELFGKAFDIMDEYIRDPAKQLAELRQITPDTDVKIVQYTLSQLGFDIPRDLVEEHADIIRRFIHMLPLYHEISGTKDYPRFISFLLDRTIDVKDLYSRDYCTFTEKPLGALNIDGGDWYMTTHVLLSIQWKEADNDRLNIEQRLLDLFYQFAPIQTVVHKYITHIDLHLELKGAGKIVFDDTDFLDLYEDLVVTNILIEGPETVSSSTTQPYRLKVTYNNSRVDYYDYANWSMSNASASINSLGLATFGRVPVTTQVSLSATHPFTGQVVSLPITILADDLLTVVDMEISGLDEVIQGSSTGYTAQGLLTNYTYAPLYPKWTVDDPDTYIDQNGNLVTQNLGKDREIYITAEADDQGYGIIRAKKVLLKYVPVELHLVDLSIDQTNVQIFEGGNANLTATATLSDTSTVSVFPLWELDVTPAATLDPSEGRLTGRKVHGDTQARVHATYTLNGITKTDSLTFVVKAPVIDVDNMFIVGPTTLQEKTSAKYVCNILWTSGQVTTVKVEWFANHFDIDDNGLFKAGSVGATKTVNISCKFYYKGVTHVRDIDVNVLNDVVSLQSINVLGPDSVKEDESGQYKAYGVWSDGTISEVAATWSLPASVSSFASIGNLNGILSITDTPTESIAEVTATYNLGPNTYTYSRQVVFVPVISVVESLVITGPTTVTSNEEIQLIATAYDGNNDATIVTPKWETISPDETNEPDVHADVVSITGLLRGRPVNEDKEVIVKATYFKEVAFYSVVVTPPEIEAYENIVGGRLIGPTTVYPGETVSYAHAVTYEDCDDELLVSSDWSLSVDESIAEITQDGYLTMNTPVSNTIVVTSRHTNCPNEVDIRTLTVQLMGENITLTSMTIVGENLISDNSTTVYTAEVLDSTGATRAVNPIWTLIGGNSNIQLDSNGILYVDNLAGDEQVTISAQYSEGSNTITATKVVDISTIAPLWGVGPIGVNDDNGILLYLPNEMTTSESGGEFTINVQNASDYGYFAHPSSLGTAIFTDTNSNFQGGWDGATWPNNGDVGVTNGPLTILRTIGGQQQSWKLYRTDFAGIGQFTFRVDYQ